MFFLSCQYILSTTVILVKFFNIFSLKTTGTCTYTRARNSTCAVSLCMRASFYSLGDEFESRSGRRVWGSAQHWGCVSMRVCVGGGVGACVCVCVLTWEWVWSRSGRRVWGSARHWGWTWQWCWWRSWSLWPCPGWTCRPLPSNPAGSAYCAGAASRKT